MLASDLRCCWLLLYHLGVAQSQRMAQTSAPRVLLVLLLPPHLLPLLLAGLLVALLLLVLMLLLVCIVVPCNPLVLRSPLGSQSQ